MQLAIFLKLHEDLQVKHMGGSPRTMSPDDKMRFLSQMHTALITELTEALDETGWKPWASSDHINQDRYLSEIVDALHFFLNLILVAGDETTDAENLADAISEKYLAKREKNAQRQIEGYDGVTGKCPWCHTDLAEADEKLLRERMIDFTLMKFCCLGCSNSYVYNKREANG